jgi:hypothetical protein
MSNEENQENKNKENGNNKVNVDVTIDPEYIKFQVAKETKELQDKLDATNEELRQAKLGNAPTYKGATLNAQQLGLEDEIDNIHPDIPVEMWEADENKLSEALKLAVDGKFGEDRRKEAIAVTKEMRAKTDAVARIRGLEWELESKPLNRFEFQGIGKPARLLSKDEFKKNKPKMIPVKRGVEQ